MRRFPLFLLVLATGCGSADIGVTELDISEDVPGVSPAAATPGGEQSQFSEPWLITPGLGAPPVVPDPEPRCLPDGPTCYPIVLAHGFMANPEFLMFFGVADRLRERGFTVVEGEVEPFDGVAVRGAMLADQIDAVVEAYGVDKVNIIAHSMGGLDSRHAISSLGRGPKVASLTTVSTPHRGSAAADALLDEEFVDSEIVAGVLKALGASFDDELARDPKLRSGLEDLSEAAAPAFNAANPDYPGVRYASWAGLSNVFGWERPGDEEACQGVFWKDQRVRDVMDEVFIVTNALTAHGGDRLPNDGMVTVASAHWGEFRGCITADHADEVGQINDLGPDARTGFDHLEFFDFLADDLVREGF